MEIGKAVTLFLGEYKPSTRKAYTHALLPMKDWLGPARDIAGVKPEMLVEYFQEWVEKRPYALATKRKFVKSIRTFFNWCVKLELIARSPAQYLRSYHDPSDYVPKEKAMSDAELAALLDYLRYKTIPRDYALLLFLADTGCRRGGAAGLRLQDIQWDKLIATVTEKGDKERLVAFSAQCARAIRHWIAYRGEHYQVIGFYVFSERGEEVKPENLSLIIRRACKKVGIRTLSTHSLRHRKGHQLGDSRIAPSVSATAMGISVDVMMKHYYPADWERAEKALRELFTVAPEPPNVVRFEPRQAQAGD